MGVCVLGALYCVSLAFVGGYFGRKKVSEFAKKRPEMMLLLLLPPFLLFASLGVILFVPMLGCKSPTREYFENEFGNRILLSVRRARIQGTRPDGTEGAVDGVRMYLRGPTSDTTNTVTEQEAARLSSALRRLL